MPLTPNPNPSPQRREGSKTNGLSSQGDNRARPCRANSPGLGRLTDRHVVDVKRAALLSHLDGQAGDDVARLRADARAVLEVGEADDHALDPAFALHAQRLDALTGLLRLVPAVQVHRADTGVHPEVEREDESLGAGDQA